MAELDKDCIATAALAIADRHGVDGFTMRSVANALDVTPMALYHHVRDKAALVTLLVDTVIRKHPLPPTSGVWQDDLLSMAQWMRQSMLNHPVVAQLRHAYNVWTPAMLQMTERWLSLWQQSALDLEDAVLAATTSSMAISGLVKEEMIFYTMQHPGNEILAWLPNVRVMFNTAHNRDAQFELAVRSLIDGLHARLTLNQNTSARTQSIKKVGKATHRTQRQQQGNSSAHSHTGRKLGTRRKS
jgi:TetR/AcrR family tetracycline transcriptional repressor